MTMNFQEKVRNPFAMEMTRRIALEDKIGRTVFLGVDAFRIALVPQDEELENGGNWCVLVQGLPHPL
jgi:hypothetical protein